MSDHVHGHIISTDDLEDAGVHLEQRDDLELPTVDHSHDFVVDDDDSAQCRYMTQEELYHLHIDNPVAVTPVQPDVWTLETDNEVVTFTYASGAQWSVRLGDIGLDSGPAAERYRKTGGLVYPTDGWNVVLNATTVPRLSAMRAWILDQTLKASEERLKMAELVNTFAGIMSHYSGALDR